MNEITPDNFLGLPLEHSSIDNSKIVILPVPFDKTTTYIKGTDKGPKALIQASKNLELYDITTDTEIYKKGIYTATANKYTSSKQMIDGVYKEVGSYLKKDKFVVTIGGEHSISLAPIKAHSEYHKPISILHFDAHADLMPAYENNPYSHASVMSRVSQLPLVSEIISIGIRSMAVEEKEFMKLSHTFFAHNLHDNNDWMEEVINMVSNNVYITFDLDVFDSSVMPSTGTPEPGGLFWHQIDKFFKLLAKRKKIMGFDVVELCPIKNFVAPDFLAAKLIYKLLSYIFKN
jgi:agmatinase